QPALVLLLFLGREAYVKIGVFHRSFSRRLAPLELGDRAVDRADETAVTLRFRLDPCPVRLERGEPVEGRVIEDGGDLLQREAELAMQQDLLQPQELFF